MKLPKQKSGNMNQALRASVESTVKDNLAQSLDALMSLNGTLAAMVVAQDSGMILAKAGGGFDLDVAAAGNSEVVKAKLNTAQMLGLNQKIEDIMITLDSHYHIIRPITNQSQPIFIYVALDKGKANLALTRMKIADVEKQIVI